MPDPVLVWVHGDSLSPEDPAARRHPGAPRVFVFDRPLLEASQLSFKRLFFLYECAGGAADEIRLGDPVDELLEACRLRGLHRIAATESISPRFQELAGRLQAVLDLEIVPADAWIGVPENCVPRRFSEFWRKHGQEWQ